MPERNKIIKNISTLFSLNFVSIKFRKKCTIFCEYLILQFLGQGRIGVY